MFGLGFWEIAVIAVVIIIVIKPSDLPRMIRRAGRFFGQVKDFYRETVSTISELGRDIDKPMGGKK